MPIERLSIDPGIEVPLEDASFLNEIAEELLNHSSVPLVRLAPGTHDLTPKINPVNHTHKLVVHDTGQGIYEMLPADAKARDKRIETDHDKSSNEAPGQIFKLNDKNPIATVITCEHVGKLTIREILRYRP